MYFKLLFLEKLSSLVNPGNRFDLLWQPDAESRKAARNFFVTLQKKSAMSFKRVTLKHELSSTIEHSLEVDSNFLEMTRKADSVITYGPDKVPETSTELEVTLKVNEKTKSAWRETRLNGKMIKFQEEDILDKQEKKEFENFWSKKWAPSVKDSELFQLGGQPMEKMQSSKPV